MKRAAFSRREMIGSTMAVAAMALSDFPLSVFAADKTAEPGVLIPFLDQQPTGKMLRWEQLKSWITPNEQVFSVSHYGTPNVDRDNFRLEIGGLVKKPKVLTLEEIQARRPKSVVATLECSGNGSSPGFMGAIGNVRWTGAPLAPLLKECGMLDRAIELVFFGADEKIEKIRDKEYLQNFARSLGREIATRDDILLAYQMNGEPLTQAHGAPLRLVVPGWFGIAWVKWLSRIEALDRRFMSKYMAREYVTIRGQEKEGKTIWRETSVGPIDIKSVIARAEKIQDNSIRLMGAAWTDGTPLRRVEVKIDDGPWAPATIAKTPSSRYAWRFFSFQWPKPEPGEHVVVSRAIDAEGRVQPAPDDSDIKLKRTYWEANQQWPRRIRVEPVS